MYNTSAKDISNSIKMSLKVMECKTKNLQLTDFKHKVLTSRGLKLTSHQRPHTSSQASHGQGYEDRANPFGEPCVKDPCSGIDCAVMIG